jgi:hypothetical protein
MSNVGASKIIGQGVKKVKDFFKSRGKNPTPGVAIKSVKPNVPDTKIQKKIRDLKIETQKLKGSGKKLDQTIFEIQNKKPITFKKSTKKTESNKERYKKTMEKK